MSFGWLVIIGLVIVLVGGLLLKTPLGERIPGYRSIRSPWDGPRRVKPVVPPFPHEDVKGTRDSGGTETIAEALPAGTKGAQGKYVTLGVADRIAPGTTPIATQEGQSPVPLWERAIGRWRLHLLTRNGGDGCLFRPQWTLPSEYYDSARQF